MQRIFLLIAVLAAALGACGGDAPNSSDDRLDVVANFYPVAYAAERVGGDLVAVRNMTPAGVEPHDLELTSDDVDRIAAADAVFYVGSDFQPAIARAVARRDDHAVDVGKAVISGDDAHFWLDPVLMATAVDSVADGLAAADPEHASSYARNATAYKDELKQLDADFAAALARCKHQKFVTAHAAFGYLAARYGLTQHAISGIEPESEPDPARLASLADLIERDGITTVFYEELVPRDFADTLARETGARTDALSPLEGLTDEERDAGETYLTVMRRNLTKLARALDCRAP